MRSLSPARLPRREHDTHKGTYGRVLLVAGSEPYPGAAVLAALGAGRAGAGLVELAIPASIVPEVLPAVPFAILRRCPHTDGGALGVAAADAVLEAAGPCQAVAVGPGWGQERETAGLLSALLDGVEAPLVVDADGLNLMSLDELDARHRRGRTTVLTPHPGEFARLAGGRTPKGEARLEQAADFARRHGAVVALKGHRTVVTDGDRAYVETAGNPGLATGGMGDVLTGFVVALLARLEDAAAATALAVRLHALAGDRAADELGEDAVLPQDVADRFGVALEQSRTEDFPASDPLS